MGQLYGDAVILLCFVFTFLPQGKTASAPSVTIELGQNFGEFSVLNSGDEVELISTVSVERKLNGS